MKFLYKIFIFCSFFYPVLSHADSEKWSWHYTGFTGPSGNKSYIRYGSADITISDGKINGYIIDAMEPDIHISISGTISGDEVFVMLPTFFPSYAIEFSGKKRMSTYEGCKYEEITLQYELPNGEVMVLLKTTGKCF